MIITLLRIPMSGSAAMGTAGPTAAHLTQEKLSDKDEELLAGLRDWISHADFEPKSNICVDKSIGEKQSIIYGLDLIKKVSPKLHSCDNNSS